VGRQEPTLQAEQHLEGREPRPVEERWRRCTNAPPPISTNLCNQCRCVPSPRRVCVKGPGHVTMMRATSASHPIVAPGASGPRCRRYGSMCTGA
jgi:hypothetical protein